MTIIIPDRKIILPEGVKKYNFIDLGWCNRLEALHTANQYAFLNYSMYFGLEIPCERTLPYDLKGLIYSGKSAGRKDGKKHRGDNKDGKRIKFTKKTSGYDRMSTHNRHMMQRDLSKIKEAKYIWFWHQRQLHPDWQVWYHFFAPPIDEDTFDFNIKVAVSITELQIIELYNDNFKDSPPMNREHRRDVSHEKKTSASTIMDSTTQTLVGLFEDDPA